MKYIYVFYTTQYPWVYSYLPEDWKWYSRGSTTPFDCNMRYKTYDQFIGTNTKIIVKHLKKVLNHYKRRQLISSYKISEFFLP